MQTKPFMIRKVSIADMAREQIKNSNVGDVHVVPPIHRGSFTDAITHMNMNYYFLSYTRASDKAIVFIHIPYRKHSTMLGIGHGKKRTKSEGII